MELPEDVEDHLGKIALTGSFEQITQCIKTFRDTIPFCSSELCIQYHTHLKMLLTMQIEMFERFTQVARDNENTERENG